MRTLLADMRLDDVYLAKDEEPVSISTLHIDNLQEATNIFFFHLSHNLFVFFFKEITAERQLYAWGYRFTAAAHFKYRSSRDLEGTE